MEKNYYEILEVDKNASPEIIRKAYNVLAKKYHPDLQSEDGKQIAEERLKLINEAYEVIGKESSREQYNISLSQSFVPIDIYNEVCIENQHLRNKIKNLEYQNNFNNNYQKRTIYSPKSNSSEQNNNENDYYNYSLNKKFSNLFKNIIALFLTLLILLIIWNFPFINNLFKNILSF